MHGRMPSLILPLIASLVMAGSGYSAWVFASGNYVSSSSTIGRIAVAAAKETPHMTICLGTAEDGGFIQDHDGTFEFVLDQGRDPASLDDGIYLGKGLEAYDLAIRLDDPRFDDDYPGCSVNITYHVDSFLSPNLASYISYKGPTFGETCVGTAAFQGSDNGFAYYWDANVLNRWSYVKKPQSFEEYEAMVEDLSAPESREVKLRFTVSLRIVAQ